jgi:hypothetical protein
MNYYSVVISGCSRNYYVTMLVNLCCLAGMGDPPGLIYPSGYGSGEIPPPVIVYGDTRDVILLPQGWVWGVHTRWGFTHCRLEPSATGSDEWRARQRKKSPPLLDRATLTPRRRRSTSSQRRPGWRGAAAQRDLDGEAETWIRRRRWGGAALPEAARRQRRGRGRKAAALRARVAPLTGGGPLDARGSQRPEADAERDALTAGVVIFFDYCFLLPSCCIGGVCRCRSPRLLETVLVLVDGGKSKCECSKLHLLHIICYFGFSRYIFCYTFRYI